MDTTEKRRVLLARWLKERCLPEATDVEVLGLDVPPAGGFSNVTLIFDVAYRTAGKPARQTLVARVEQVTHGLFPQYDLDLQYDLMEVLFERSDVRVPRVLAKERAPTIFGAPFFVMEHVEGTIPPDDPVFTADGWVLDLSEDHQRELEDNALAALALIHAVDWQALDLAQVIGHDLAADPVLQQIERRRRHYEWVLQESHPNPVIEVAFDWISAHVPTAEEPVVLNWGDCRLGNMVFARDRSVAAVLDWELASLASPGLDLGWWTFSMRYFTDGLGLPMPPGFRSLDEVVSRYQSLTGYHAGNHRFYEILAGVRSATIVQRIADLSIKAGALPPDSDMALNNGSTQMLARLLDLPAPGAPADSFKRL